MENFTVLLLLLIVVLLAYNILTMKQTQTELRTQPVEIITETQPESPLPYWVWYGQPWYTPTYLSPYWFYDVPYYGPITGGSYWPDRWRGHPGGGHPGGGHPGPAMGGSTGVAHGGGGGHGGRGH